MTHPSPQTPPRPRSRQVRQRRLQALLLAALAALGVAGALVGRSHNGHGPGTPRPAAPPPRATLEPVRLISSVVGHLSAPEQNAALAQVGSASAVLLGGLTSGNTARTDVVVLHGAREVRDDVLPLAWRDAAAVRLGRAVYLFGGANNITTSDQILRVSLSGKPAMRVGSLPRPLADIAAATAGSSAFIVGGFDGKSPSDKILSWRPQHRVRVVGKLPHPLRYPAVAALGRDLYILGGTTPAGPSHDVFKFDTVTHKLSLAARLPRPSTHAAASAFGCCVYMIGGVQVEGGTPTRRIFAVQPGRRHVRPAGRLPVPISDLGAVSQRRRILAIGGRTSAGTVASIVELRPQR
ncbi:MAG TPA: hypothetical protein VGI67_01025 [Thermoleophilaceae bacterium]